jgi:putative (di)nucleoside polyphosphate hydrolase
LHWERHVPRVLSAGVLVRPAPGQLLLGHCSGNNHWDIPKGLVEDGEAPRAAALRELTEETGLALDASAWHEVGRCAYNKAKDLWLFRSPLLGSIDLATLSCTSMFVDRFGRTRPEFDRFAIADRASLQSMCAPSMTRLLLSLEW